MTFASRARLLVVLAGVVLGIALSACTVGIVRIEPGRPVFSGGEPLSYWIWHDGGGWHLRTTTERRRHRFHGWVEPINGAISDIHPTRLEWNDRVRAAPRGIEFDFETDGSEDGFDWRVSSGCNRFFLQVDGNPNPVWVHVGREGRNPEQIPFERCR